MQSKGHIEEDELFNLLNNKKIRKHIDIKIGENIPLFSRVTFPKDKPTIFVKCHFNEIIMDDDCDIMLQLTKKQQKMFPNIDHVRLFYFINCTQSSNIINNKCNFIYHHSYNDIYESAKDNLGWFFYLKGFNNTNEIKDVIDLLKLLYNL